jgi:hypothetical protein
MKERRIINTVLIMMTVFVTGCYYDVEEILYPAGACNTDNMSYQTHIAPILQRNCYSCHSAAANTGNITLEGHAALLPYVTSGRLLGAVRHESGFQAMPQNASKLIECDIAKIERWVQDGSLNN